MFLQDVKLDSLGGVVDVVPTAGNNFTARKGDFYLYFDLYLKSVPAQASIRYELEDEENERDYQKQ